MKPTIVMVPTIYTEHNWRKQSVFSGLQCSKCVWKGMCWREGRGSWLVARVSWLAAGGVGKSRAQATSVCRVWSSSKTRQDSEPTPLCIWSPSTLAAQKIAGVLSTEVGQRRVQGTRCRFLKLSIGLPGEVCMHFRDRRAR